MSKWHSDESYTNRAEDAFSEQDNSFVEEYLTAIRETWKDISGAIRRMVLLMLLAMALFELLVRSAVEEFSLGPVKVKELTLVQKSLPVFVAFVVYELVVLLARWHDIESVHLAIMKKYHNQLVINDFHIPLYPQMLAVYGIPRTPFGVKSSPFLRFTDSFGTWANIAFLFLPAVFEVYAFYQLIKLGLADALLWIALLPTALLLIAAMVSLILLIKEV